MLFQIVVSLMMVCGLATSCVVPSSTSPPSSEYPADISGHVTIAEKVKHSTAIAVPPNRDNNIFWIVDISVKNNTYSDPIEASLETGYGGWRITTNDKVYHPRASDEELSIALRQTGQFVFYFEVPRSLQINDAQICYQGQEPYSYGELTGGDKVAVYDWDLRTVVEATQEGDQYEQYFVKREITGYKKVGEIGKVDVTEPVYKDVYMELKTVAHWEEDNLGMEGKYWSIPFSATSAPWVINCGYKPREFTPLDPLGSEATFLISVVSKADYNNHRDDLITLVDPLNLLGTYRGEYRGVSDKGTTCIVVHGIGDYVIVLYTSDIVSWWVKVGVE